MSSTLRDTILDMDRAVPRYTSYPTAPNFLKIDKVDESPYLDWLKKIDKDSGLSLYFHVPFCSKMCWYCGCHTKVTKRYEPVEAYINLALREIEILRSTIGYAPNIKHIHFGGGTPGVISPEDFVKIFKHLSKNFNIEKNAEIAVEIDPRSLDRHKAEAYAQCGVNRVSLGVQDLDEKVLEAVNRKQSFALSSDAVELFRSQNINSISIDLLYGLPHQNLQTMEKTIDKAMELDPDRISLFGYAHVPWMKKHMRLIKEETLPDKEMRYDLFATGEAKLLEYGYIPIGIDHFAKKSDNMAIAAKNRKMHRNFQGYTTDDSKYLIGIGLSSIGKSPDGYVQNAIDMPTYEKAILSGRLPVKKYCELTLEDKLRANIIENLMCNFQVNIKEICKNHHFPENHLDYVLENISIFESKKLVDLGTKGTIKILPHARIATRLICSEFDAYFLSTQKKPMHAKAI